MNTQAAPSYFALFPGQGAQHVGMGKDLLENFAVAKEVFEEASDAIHQDLKKLCLDGPESDLTLTENTQPALLTVSVAAFRAAQSELGFKPLGAAGHSLGEYSALVALGALPLTTAVSLVKERGKAMQVAVPAGLGTMAAIMGLSDQAIVELCKQATDIASDKRKRGESPATDVPAVCDPANFNAPGQIVIAGSTDGVAEAIALVKSAVTGSPFAGGKAIPLQVSAPFHCKLMTPAREHMAKLFQKAASPKTPFAPYIPNRTARATTEAGVVFELLIEQIDHPVLWSQSMSTLLQSGTTRFVEMGPGSVLTGLAKRIAKPLNISPTLCNVHTAENIRSFEALLKTVGGTA